MNADRRMIGRVLIELLNEGHHNGEISDQAHAMIGEALAHLRHAEYHQLKAQEKYEGQNPTTDKQVAICRVALPALEKALEGYNADDFQQCATEIKLAITTDGKRTRRKKR